MEWEHTKIVEPYGTIQPENEIDHQHKFKNHIRRKFGVDVLIIFPTVRQGTNVKLRRSDKLTFFARMPFQNGDGVMK